MSTLAPAPPLVCACRYHPVVDCRCPVVPHCSTAISSTPPSTTTTPGQAASSLISLFYDLRRYNPKPTRSMQCGVFCGGFGFLVVIWLNWRKTWWADWIKTLIHQWENISRVVVPLLECGSAAPSRFKLLLDVIFHRWNDALIRFVHHMLSPTQNVIISPSIAWLHIFFQWIVCFEIVW
jgi:hypothetical protein